MNWITNFLASFKLMALADNTSVGLPIEPMLDVSKMAPLIKDSFDHPLTDLDIFFDGSTPYGLMSLLSTMSYIGDDTTNVKFFKRESPIWKADINYNSIIILVKTYKDKTYCTPFIDRDRVSVEKYEDIYEIIELYNPCILKGDIDISQWAVIYLNTATSEYDMRLSCLYE